MTDIDSLETSVMNRVTEAEKLTSRRSLSLSLVFLCLALNSARAVDPNRHISQYAHTAWRIQDGAFSGAPNAITQTADGYLWIGTLNGLVRFDGVRFMPWSPPNEEPLSSGIFSLLAGADGSLWIGTGTNLARFKDGKLVIYQNGLGRVNAIIKDRHGTVWITRSRVRDDNGPLCEVADTSLRCKGKKEGIVPAYGGPMIQDLDGNLWMGSANTLTRWKTGSTATFAPPGLKGAQNVSGIQALAVTGDGALWSGMSRSGRGLGLQRLVAASWRPFVGLGLNGENLEVTALFVDRENVLWVGTVAQGVYRIHDGKAEHFFSADGLSSDSVSAFYEDREGNLWIATTEGVDCFHDTPVVTFSTREGLSSNLAYSVLAARDGTVWIGNHGSLDYLRGDKLSSIPLGAGFLGRRVTCLFEDHEGTLWVGIDDGLYVYEKGKFEKITGVENSPIGTVIAITEDQAGDIWAEAIGNPTKLIRIRNRRVCEQLRTPEMPVAVSLAAGPGGGIWLGLANGGLARYQHDDLTTLSSGQSQNPRVLQILVRTDGSVLGASSAGLVYGQNGTLRILTKKNGLPCDNLYSLVSDARDRTWLYMQCGLVRVENTELQKWWEDSRVVVKSEIFDVLDGVRPWGTPFEPQASRSPDGRLWFANENVVQMIDPSNLRRNAVPPPVHVEEVLADHKTYSPAAEVVLPALTRDIEIDYTAQSYISPQKVRFRYKLEGRDPVWQEPGTRRQAFYNDLRPGKYKFRVIACNNDGVWNEEGATLNFTVTPAWYQTNWFLVLCSVTGIFLVWALYTLRVRQIARGINARFDERLAERTRIARDLHDTFVQTIQGSKLVADDALEQSGDPIRMHRTMEQLSVWLGQATQEGRAALNSLRTSTTQTNDLAAALRRVTEDGFIPGSLSVTFSVAGDVREMHPIVRDEIFRIGYEAIRNACMHSRASQMEVEIRYADDLALRVKDNGSGMDPDIADRGKDGHFGIRGMRERADRIRGKLTMVSSPDAGTEVKLVVPGDIIFQPTFNAEGTLLARITTWFRRMGRM